MSRERIVARFEMGGIYVTPGALERLTECDVREALQRHARGDWGHVGSEDWEANDRALDDGARLLSSYRTASGEKFWVITEADRSATTVLLPEEY